MRETSHELESRPEVTAGVSNVVVAVADNKYFLGAPACDLGRRCADARERRRLRRDRAGGSRPRARSLLVARVSPRGAPPAAARARRRPGAQVRMSLPSRAKRPPGCMRSRRSRSSTAAVTTLLDGLPAVVDLRATQAGGANPRRRGTPSEVRKRSGARARGSPARSAAALEAEATALLPEVLCWFGPEGEAGLELLVEAGVLTQRNEELRQGFLAGLGALAEQTGLTLPIERTEDGTWAYRSCRGPSWNRLERRLSREPVSGTA